MERVVGARARYGAQLDDLFPQENASGSGGYYHHDDLDDLPENDKPYRPPHHLPRDTRGRARVPTHKATSAYRQAASSPWAPWSTRNPDAPAHHRTG